MTSVQNTVWVVDDSIADFGLISEAVAEAGAACELRRVGDGAEALLMARTAGHEAGASVPSLCLVDLHLPCIGGREIVTAFRENDACNGMPILVLSSCASPSDVQSLENISGVRYAEKPSEYEEWLSLGNQIRELLNCLETSTAGNAGTESSARERESRRTIAALAAFASSAAVHPVVLRLLLENNK